ncbi:gastric triacylglycerol lipase-like [Penaeus monodon]|uniref:gastric triacylglycerol lipase-like n=1 Tax=Penaeus monodon TaxID=6687 RepID=UPI0018A7B56B|nr:gastric triacylglycerol lipase-like [Penaeus monodon]
MLFIPYQGMAVILLALVGSAASPTQGSPPPELQRPSAGSFSASASLNGQGRQRRGALHPHTFLTTPELIQARGYPSEVHHVISPDGYILQMHRIPCGRRHLVNGGRCDTGGRRRVVFIQHCLLCSSADFVMNDPDQALGFIMADAGYDVWLGNTRGNVYSRRHIRLSPKQPEFWDFSWDEFAKYDMPTMLQYVRKITGVPILDYIGHSMGTTIFFVMMNYHPHINNWIRVMVGMAPVAYMHHKRAPISAFAPFVNIIDHFLEDKGFNEIAQSTTGFSTLASAACSPKSIVRFICSLIHFLIDGPTSDYVDKDYLPVIFAHTPAGTSRRVVTHFLQVIASEKFQAYDHGRTRNLKMYGSVAPPVYSLGKIKVPVGIFWSENDWVADPRDVYQTASELPNVTLYQRVPPRDFSHTDFLWAENARLFVYNPLMEFLDSYH